jgi:hypothetical protein
VCADYAREHARPNDSERSGRKNVLDRIDPKETNVSSVRNIFIDRFLGERERDLVQSLACFPH